MRFTVLFIFIQLFASAQISLVKGPYLQIGTPGSMIVKWQTNYPTSTKCIYGTNPAFLNLSYQNSNADTVHEAYLSGLQPYKKYYYSIGSNTFVIQGDTNNYFVTSPAPGAQGNYRFWITGDCGNGSVNQAEVRNKYLLYNVNRHTDGWLLLGDNAYNDGLDAEYNSNFFSYYQNNIMKKTVLWPAIGNHDYANSLSNQNSHNVPYYSIFNLPKNGEAGGVISGTEAFYSYNYGNIHFVALDSYGHELNQYRLYDTLGPQVQWLKQDLAANTLPWVVVYFHHPPYTMGSHNSDNESELYSIRQNLVRILERYNVDFVFNGHSHSYERSKLMNGHWGNENTFNAATHHLSSSSALYNGSANSCPYIKNTHQKGTVYVVSGSAGSVGGISASFPHDAMYYSNASEGGSLIMDVRNNRCDFRWLCGDGILRDSFTVFKNVNKVTTYSVSVGQNILLAPSWPGDYLWNNTTNTVSVLSVTASNDTVIFVRDKYQCVADTFKIKVFTGIKEFQLNGFSFEVFPNPANEDVNIEFELAQGGEADVRLITSEGKTIPLEHHTKLNAGKTILRYMRKNLKLESGIYFLEVIINSKSSVKKLAVTN